VSHMAEVERGASREPAGRVAWVTGASRGVGRGVAIALGQAGWTVYVTARSSGAATTGHLPGTVEATAAEVTASGGAGIPVACDHRDDAAVRAVATRIQSESGRLDLLVNNAWGGYERLNAGGWEEWNAPLWRQPVELFDSMFTGGVRMHYVTLAACAPLLIAKPGSMTVLISVAIPDPGQQATETETGTGAAYAMAKAADDRLALVAAQQLREYAVASLVVYPDWVRTEGIMQFASQVDLTGSQSPQGVGRAIAALAADPDRFSLTGTAPRIADLAARYGVDVSS
jgi:NAD(P)-dependent dehydrogenase (short-subunit alcohol dehydrogenase family)